MATASALKSSSSSAASRTAVLRATAEGNGIRYGLYTAAVMVIYTIIAAFAGFLGKIEAGSLNVVVIITGVVLSIRHLSKIKGRNFGYLQGYGTGIITALVASVLLGATFWLLGGISQQAVAEVRSRDLFGSDLGVLISGLGIILLGTMTGVITSLIAMQYYRNSDEKQVVEDRS
jgi:hypothetical protein